MSKTKNYKNNTDFVYKKFDYKASRNIEKIMDNDIYLAIKLYEEYLDVYHEDYSSYEKYLRMLINVGYFEKAFEVMKYLEMKALDGKIKNIKDGKTKDNLISNIIHSKIRLFIHKERYQEIYNYINENMDLIDFHVSDCTGIMLYLENQLKIINKKRIRGNTYLFDQIMNYDEQAFLEHLKRHVVGYEDEEDMYAFFYTDFPFEKVFEEVKKNYNIEKRIINGSITDEYYYKYDNCGIQYDEVCNFFVVRTLANRNHYLTMFPKNNIHNYPYIDLNYMKEQDVTKVRRMSQIDKFNQRYGK